MTKRLGGLVWIVAAVEYLAAQVVVAAAWHPAYNWSRNYISDLGNTACGPFALPHGTPAYVCSPRHDLMNGAFVVAGILTLLGALLLTAYWPTSRRRTVAIWLLVVAGVGKIVVGLVPENTNTGLHTLGALNLPLSGIAILLIALASPRGGMRLFGLVVAVVVMAAAVLLIAGEFAGSGLYLGFGVGGMERLASYPTNLWMVVIGIAAALHGTRRPDLRGR